MKPFIRIEKTLDEALSFPESVINIAFCYQSIQLLPNNTNSYTQISNHKEGIELEDWTVFAVTLCGQKTDITPYFMVFDNPIDSKGMPQIVWQLTNVPFDFGKQLIYLEINQLVGETFYSSPFLLTDIDKDKTARFDYRTKKTDWYESIQINTFFRQNLNRDELTTYYKISTKNTVSTNVKEKLVEKWHTGLFANDFFVNFRSMLNSNQLYCNDTRAYLYEAFEIPEISGNVNYAEKDYLLTFDYDELLSENINDMTVIERLEELERKCAIFQVDGAIIPFGLPAEDIPPGWQEVTDFAGKTMFGKALSDLDPNFGLLGQTGGSLTDSITLTVPNLPPHFHYITIGGDEGEGGEVGQGGTSQPGTEQTQSTGYGTPFSVDILNPYRVVNFIEYVGI